MEKLHMSDEDTQILFDGIYKAPIGFSIFALDGDDSRNSPLVLRYINEEGAKVVGREPQDLVNKTMAEAIPEAVGGPFDLGIREAFATQKPTEVLIHDDSNKDHVVAFRLKMLPLASGLVLTMLIEVTTETILEREFKTERRTSLASRAYFDDVLHDLSVELPTSQEHLGVLFLDIDKFKYINDTYGHVCGDELLTTLAQRLRSITPKPKLLARWGGDEFAVITQWDREENLNWAQAVLDEIARPFNWGAESIPIRLSVGVITVPAGSHVDVRKLMMEVDKAMYQAKHGGGDKICEVPVSEF